MDTRNALLRMAQPRPPDPMLERPWQDQWFLALDRLFGNLPSQQPRLWNQTVRG